MKGVWAAVLTPIDAEFSPDSARAVPYYAQLLDRGCDGLNLLGTTGEAMSFSADLRAKFMEELASSGLPMARAMVGTGAASLGDVVRLTRLAFAEGFAAALIMPPFFVRDASDDGVVAFFDAVLSRANPPCRSVLLYNFPRMSGITFHAALVDRLVAEFPEAVAGMKDSSNDARLQSDVMERHPDLLIFPGSESDLIEAKARGVAGCISGSVSLWPELAQAVFAQTDAAQGGELTRKRAGLDGLPFVPAVRYLTAVERGDPAWERAMPPHTSLTRAERSRLMERVRR
ncbi:MAG TPA: dihydrodipicolinate synthase family protein [Candidatus Dormibacteraeota bacterium]|nr:dihydrodipicolinate synthase family protein [Candidatus Dormibacteraeota bacterium]